MMFIAHRNPTFSGSTVTAAAQFDFKDGVAQIDDLSPTQVAAISVLGWSVVDPAIIGAIDADDVPEPLDDEPELTPRGKTGGRVKREYEINEKPAPEDMEKPGPEINAKVAPEDMEKPGPGIGG